VSPGSAPWWRSGVLYQIYPRSFADTNDDGVGDIPGIIHKLDYLQWLGVDGVWINPTMPSPNDDWGYDVADFRGVHPELGTLEDMDQLVTEARARDIAILLDLVPNHTSDRHEWFQDSRSSRTAAHRDWYVWRDPMEDGSPPNNWVSVFGGPAWKLDEPTGQFYLHNFLDTQPDLNWWNDDVRSEFDDILRFWFDRGIAGFRIDVAHGIVKDEQLRDNLPSTDDDHPRVRLLGQQQNYNMNRPEVHEVLKRWRSLSDGYEEQRVLVGETLVLDLERWAAFYGSGNDELHLAFNFPLIFAPLAVPEMRTIVETTEQLVPQQAWPVWTGSNHDTRRLATRWCNDDGDKVRCAMMMLLTLRGTPFLYYGDEIGMPDTDMRPEAALDPVKFRTDDRLGRDPGRTPMHWSDEQGAGFTTGAARPWLPLGDYASCNVAAQRDDPDSILNFTRDLIALRRKTPGLVEGSYRSMHSPDGVWAWARGHDAIVALNLSDERATLELQGRIAIATQRRRDGEDVAGALELMPWEGVVVNPYRG
jgi:alpha-glucosidase